MSREQCAELLRRETAADGSTITLERTTGPGLPIYTVSRFVGGRCVWGQTGTQLWAEGNPDAYDGGPRLGCFAKAMESPGDFIRWQLVGVS